MGSGFPDFMARGTEEPARMMEARRASSMPYGELLRRRVPPRMYYCRDCQWGAVGRETGEGATHESTDCAAGCDGGD